MTDARFDDGRRKLLDAISGASDITLIRPLGNIGDHLILAGTRQLLAGVMYTEVSVRRLAELSGGQIAVIAGCGGWCGAFHEMPAYLPLVEERFERVVVFPSSFDTSVASVRNALSRTRALVFARESTSYDQIRDLCSADIAHDGAFYFDYGPYRRDGRGTLTAFRTDREAVSRTGPPAGNNDISLTCETLDEWLWTIARHDLIRTDRAHVIIAGSLLGKRVEFRSSNYHKVAAIVDYSLRAFPLSAITDPVAQRSEEAPPHVSAQGNGGQPPGPDVSVPGAIDYPSWVESVRLIIQDLDEVIPEGATFLFADDEKLGPLPSANRRRLPFLERDDRYWGPPEDDGQAIRECERMRKGGAGFLVFAWPAFWWLDHYQAFDRYLRANFACLLENERLVVFDLRAVR